MNFFSSDSVMNENVCKPLIYTFDSQWLTVISLLAPHPPLLFSSEAFQPSLVKPKT